jgi:hypothetical protein
MTNVPDKIREAWKDLYVLFDTSYEMHGSDKEWLEYWDKANKLVQKYGDEIPLLEMVIAIGHMIEKFNADRGFGTVPLEWPKGEEYPYPKKEVK